GISVGGFACLGAWTAHLSAPWRRRLRWGLSCYFPGPLLLSGLIYDLSHPVGWVVGLLLGNAFVAGTDHPYDERPMDRREVPWLVVVAVLGAAAGIYVGWTGGGIGGIFGWGPGTPDA
ncbi:MAG: hypothetical protein ABWZ99_19475, partial [Ilumatobacteraceae bacterium]